MQSLVLARVPYFPSSGPSRIYPWHLSTNRTKKAAHVITPALEIYTTTKEKRRTLPRNKSIVERTQVAENPRWKVGKRFSYPGFNAFKETRRLAPYGSKRMENEPRSSCVVCAALPNCTQCPLCYPAINFSLYLLYNILSVSLFSFSPCPSLEKI